MKQKENNMERYTGFDFDNITLEDCTTLYKNNGYVVINDGKIITIVRNGLC